MKSKATIIEQITVKRDRLALYLKREAEMLDGGVQSYGIGSRNLARYNTDLSAIRAAIKELEKEIADLEGELSGRAKPWASSPVTGERSPARSFFHRLPPGSFRSFSPGGGHFTGRR